jgi:hypothetical protein
MARITKLGARGLKHADFVQELTGRDILVGPNGAGKTQRADALALLVLGYHPNPEVPKKGVLAHLGRPGADKLEVFAELETGGETHQIVRGFAGGKSWLEFDGKKAKTLAAGAERLAELAGNQVAILDAAAALNGTGQERLRWLLDHLAAGLQLEGLELRQPGGGTLAPGDDQHPLEWLASQRKGIEGQQVAARADLRAAEKARTEADEGLRFLPDGGAPADSLRARRDELRTSRDETRAAHQRENRDRLDELRAQLAEEKALAERAEAQLEVLEKPAEDLEARVAEAVRTEFAAEQAVQADAKNTWEAARHRALEGTKTQEIERLTGEIAKLPAGDVADLEKTLEDKRARYAHVSAVLAFLATGEEGGWGATFRAAGFVDEAWDAVEAVNRRLHEAHVREQSEIGEILGAGDKRRELLTRRAELEAALEAEVGDERDHRELAEKYEAALEGADERKVALERARQAVAALTSEEEARHKYRGLEQVRANATHARDRTSVDIETLEAELADSRRSSPRFRETPGSWRLRSRGRRSSLKESRRTSRRRSPTAPPARC